MNATTVSCLKRTQEKSPVDDHMMIDHVNSVTTIVKFKKPKNVNVITTTTSVKPMNKLIFKKPVLSAGASTSATVVQANPTTETNVKKFKKSNVRQEEKKGFKLGFVNSRGELVCRLCQTNCVTMKLFSRHRSRRYSYEELETIFASSKTCKRTRGTEVIDVDQLEDCDEDVLQAARILVFMSNDQRSIVGSSVRVEGLKNTGDHVGCKRVHEFDLNVVAVDVEDQESP